MARNQQFLTFTVQRRVRRCNPFAKFQRKRTQNRQFLNAPQYSSVTVGCQLPRASSSSSGRTSILHYFVTEH